MNNKLILRLQKLVLALTFAVLPANSIFGQEISPSEPKIHSLSNLTSPETGVNYAPLQALLAKQEWRKANDMTRQLMLKATNRQTQEIGRAHV